jgi:MerR family copper efflux transcriptional regulator
MGSPGSRRSWTARMSTTTELVKIGDFARLAETNLRTLRYYEELGLLSPAARSAGRFRYYRRTDVNRVRMVRDLQELGLHLDRICDLMAARRPGEPPERFLQRIRRALEEHDRLLQQRMHALEEQRRKAAQALHKIRECHYCSHSPRPENNFCEPCTTTGESLPELLSALFQ